MIPTYGVLIALGLVAALVTCTLASRLLELDVKKVWNLAVLATIVTLVSAKLILAIARWPEFGARAFSLDLAAAPGAIIVGALIGIGSGWLYGSRRELPLRRTADALAPALAAGGAFVWLARLEAGYAFGSISHGPLAIVFTDPLASGGVPLAVPLHPVQIYGALIDFLLFVLLFILLELPHSDGDIMGAWLFLDGLFGFFLTFLRGDDWARKPVAGFLSGGQWLAVALVVAGGLLWLGHGRVPKESGAGSLLKNAPKPPGSPAGEA